VIEKEKKMIVVLEVCGGSRLGLEEFR